MSLVVWGAAAASTGVVLGQGHGADPSDGEGIIAQIRAIHPGVSSGIVSAWVGYLQHDHVHTILGLRADQIEQCAKLQFRFRVQPADSTSEALLEAFLENSMRRRVIADSLLSAIGEILTSRQITRLRRIELQQSSSGQWANLQGVLLREDVARQLELTYEQIVQILTLGVEYEVERRRVLSEIRARKATGRDLHELREKYNVLGVLTRKQMQTWREMLGPPYGVRLTIQGAVPPPPVELLDPRSRE